MIQAQREARPLLDFLETETQNGGHFDPLRLKQEIFYTPVEHSSYIESQKSNTSAYIFQICLKSLLYNLDFNLVNLIFRDCARRPRLNQTMIFEFVETETQRDQAKVVKTDTFLNLSLFSGQE